MARATNILGIIKDIVKLPKFDKLIGAKYLSDGAVAYIKSKDGNAYEVVIRPAGQGKFKKLFGKLMTKEDLELITEKDLVMTQSVLNVLADLAKRGGKLTILARVAQKMKGLEPKITNSFKYLGDQLDDFTTDIESKHKIFLKHLRKK